MSFVKYAYHEIIQLLFRMQDYFHTLNTKTRKWQKMIILLLITLKVKMFDIELMIYDVLSDSKSDKTKKKYVTSDLANTTSSIATTNVVCIVDCLAIVQNFLRFGFLLNSLFTPTSPNESQALLVIRIHAKCYLASCWYTCTYQMTYYKIRYRIVSRVSGICIAICILDDTLDARCFIDYFERVCNMCSYISLTNDCNDL